MKVDIGEHGGTIQWGGTYYFGLSNYPQISSWELKKLVYLDEYEKSYGRKITIKCDNENIMKHVKQAIARPECYREIKPPDKITECKACHYKCCLTDYVCHTASVESAMSIISSGKLLSATKVFNKTTVELTHEPRNAAGDTFDYFDYIMFAWGNCQAGDRLVMERMLNRNPDEQDLSLGFKPGVRFYFKYNDLTSYPGYVFDGYHCVKIKDEFPIFPSLFACIIPENHKPTFEKILPKSISGRFFYLKNDCADIWEWSKKVYDFVIGLV